MPSSLGNGSKRRRRTARAATLAFGVLAAVALSPAIAHEHAEMCGPVIDADGEAVRQSDGDILMHSGSFPCPPDEVTAEPVAAEPTQPISVTISFDFDVDSPNAAGDEALQRIITDLKSLSPKRVTISGHADRAGTEAYNQDLSQRRADNVAKELIAGGMEASRITIEAFGETRPAVPTDDGVREPANRRAVVDLAF